jgi:acetyl-CoA acetyltransferase
MTREAVIVSGARTAIGTAYRGSLADVDAHGHRPGPGRPALS